MNSIKTYIGISSLFSASRMAIGATTVVYLIQKGVGLKEIALIKIIQALVVFLGEVPTGFIADKFGRKASILLSTMSAIISFMLYFYGDHFYEFALAEVFNALTLCLWSGAFDALVIQNLKDRKEQLNLGQLFSKMAIYESAGIMAAGYLGSVVGDFNLSYPFILSTVLMITCLIFILFIPEKKCKHTQEKKISLKETISEIKNSKHLYVFFGLFLLIQFAYQPILHYWQPYFESFENVSAEFLGRVFFMYVAGFSLFNFISNKALKTQKLTSEQIVHFGSFVMIFMSLGLFLTTKLEIALIIFVLIQGIGNALRNQLSSIMNLQLEDHNRATAISAVSFISRLGMFVSLGIIAIMGKVVPVQAFFLLTALGFVGVMLVGGNKAKFSIF